VTSARVRWTEHGPEPIEDEEPEAAAPPPAPAETADALRERLEARGLLRTSPTVRIRDLVDGPAPRPTPDPTTVPAEPPEEVHEASEELEPDPGGPTATVRCRSCRGVEPVSVDATGYACRTCSRVWRWAVCGSCDTLAVVPARLESWRCADCGASTRSWWRTDAALPTALIVMGRKRAAAATDHRAVVLGLIRRNGTKAAGLVMVAIFMATAAVLLRSSANGPTAERSRTACEAFAVLRPSLAPGARPTSVVRSTLNELATVASGADEAVRVRVEELAASGLPGDAGFDSAVARLAHACRS
jgi:hypothetical protein